MLHLGHEICFVLEIFAIETRWKGQKAKGIKGYKLWYGDLDSKHNGVGILVSNDILKQLVEVRKCNGKIILVRIVVGEEIISIVSAYGPQVGLDEDACNYNSVYGGFGLEARNQSGENLLEFALAKELVIENSIFRKKDEHLITYKSGGHATQVDYFLVRKRDGPHAWIVRSCWVQRCPPNTSF
ncbi:uncharacterized protein LOC130809848 [Amaranthus tricolor]|uniref:uncharacterized protein LOC130809848 n=1 Tax=Amaranthus tricolor TaxID=29722 RepID=UPI00258C4D9B|nr:uncharacterized protein LOC130809848 [Amaranthus tricolor]